MSTWKPQQQSSFILCLFCISEKNHRADYMQGFFLSCCAFSLQQIMSVTSSCFNAEPHINASGYFSPSAQHRERPLKLLPVSDLSTQEYPAIFSLTSIVKVTNNSMFRVIPPCFVQIAPRGWAWASAIFHKKVICAKPKEAVGLAALNRLACGKIGPL